eukprot:CAMPEP_0119387584 /NCGR_PEP_ID=MMETSP1334-20130426/101332_1 /TAXON_ID=127549 /ORGANISM="Calcidiscus leptoporus, Strain RCC1130" /LENGTH=31 /DNA_ID= /DNA_START= /DNA_END= /DNA_ORIENTATION=
MQQCRWMYCRLSSDTLDCVNLTVEQTEEPAA